MPFKEIHMYLHTISSSSFELFEFFRFLGLNFLFYSVKNSLVLVETTLGSADFLKKKKFLQIYRHSLKLINFHSIKSIKVHKFHWKLIFVMFWYEKRYQTVKREDSEENIETEAVRLSCRVCHHLKITSLSPHNLS